MASKYKFTRISTYHDISVAAFEHVLPLLNWLHNNMRHVAGLKLLKQR